MANEIVKNSNLWIPPRTYGVCIWIMPDGKPLSDGEGVLSAEGFVGDKQIEEKVAEAARYWTDGSDGYVEWIHGARKVTSSEHDDQAERLNQGLVPDPYEDYFDNLGR